MYYSIRHPLALGALICLAGLLLAGGPVRAQSVFEAPLDPATCGDRLNRLYDGDFEQFWSFVLRQGYSGVPEYAWSTPERAGESPEDWKVRAWQCLLEVERANQRDDRLEMRYAVGYFLWFGTKSQGFDKQPDGTPGIRERGYRMLRQAMTDGSDPALEAIIQVHLEIVQLGDQRMALAGKKGVPARLPEWWPERDQLLVSLDRLAKSGHPSAFLAISAIYSERALLASATGHDHNGRPVSGPDPRLIEASKAYRKAWEQHKSDKPSNS